MPGDAATHARDVEALLAALAGVAHARVLSDDEGEILEIRVAPEDGVDAHAATRNVQSALLAHFGRAVDHTRIRVLDDPGIADAHEPDADTAAGVVHAARARRRGHRAAAPDHGAGHTDTAASSEAGTPAADAAPRNGQANGHTDGAHHAPDTPADLGLPGAVPLEDERADGRLPHRLVAVEVTRTPPNRVACAVTVAVETRLHRARGEALDLPGAAAHAAAQAAVNALAAGGIDGLALDGVREIEMSGTDYAVVALALERDDTREIRAAAEPCGTSAERAAARAALAAARALGSL